MTCLSVMLLSFASKYLYNNSSRVHLSSSKIGEEFILSDRYFNVNRNILKNYDASLLYYIWTQTGKGIFIRILCQKNEGFVETKLRWVVGLLTRYCHLKGHLFKLGKVPTRRWISHTYTMWLWGHSLFKISSPGPVFYGTKWLLWRLHN
jgi:hypothetical protein